MVWRCGSVVRVLEMVVEDFVGAVFILVDDLWIFLGEWRTGGVGGLGWEEE
jgi:hypothetical protein